MPPLCVCISLLGTNVSAFYMLAAAHVHVQQPWTVYVCVREFTVRGGDFYAYLPGMHCDAV